MSALPHHISEHPGLLCGLNERSPAMHGLDQHLGNGLGQRRPLWLTQCRSCLGSLVRPPCTEMRGPTRRTSLTTVTKASNVGLVSKIDSTYLMLLATGRGLAYVMSERKMAFPDPPDTAGR